MFSLMNRLACCFIALLIQTCVLQFYGFSHAFSPCRGTCSVDKSLTKIDQVRHTGLLLKLPQRPSRLSSSTSINEAGTSVQQPKQKQKRSGSDETRGAALLLEGVNVYRGPSHILRDIDWRIEPRTKWALVGANGAGKSTLLKAIVGQIPFDNGKVALGAKSNQIGYLQQTAVAGSNKTIYEEAASGMEAINQARLAIEEAAEKGDLDELEKATSRFEALGGYQQDQKVSAVLKGLGFTDFQKRCDELSGGWQMRVSFAKVLLSEPSLCLLDEPSNHLDDAAKRWLARYLASYEGEGALVLVTHDVELLKSMDHIAEIVVSGSQSGGSLQIYKSCNYEQYLQLKEERAKAAVAAFEKNSEKAAKLQSFVDRFGASATKASAAQSRVKQIDRMDREGLLDAPPDVLVAKQFKPSLVLPAPPKAIGETLLMLKDASVGYDGKPLVENINLRIQRGMKVLFRGPNGAGKSTILHALRGSLPLLTGQRIENESLRLGVFTQDLAQELDPNQRAVDIVTSYAREGPYGDVVVSDQQARSALGRLGLQGEKALRYLRDLSGGEKARVALAMFCLKPSNLYLLDECSNHLDIGCVEALSDALGSWAGDRGAIVVISHDRAFCEKIDFTHVATVRDGTCVLEERAVRDKDWQVDSMSSDQRGSGKIDNNRNEATTNGTSEQKGQLDPKLRKQAFNAPKRIAKLEQLIKDAEGQIAAIEQEMISVGNDVGKLVEMNRRKDQIAAKVEKYMEEWEELEELAALVL
ncbi:hypothetical protein ACA910_001020 [Epithemia clementina (nom. ined.)]